MSQQERHPDLTGLLRGELSNDEVLVTGHHLDTCAECRSTLAELAVGHALLVASARHTGRGARPPATAPEDAHAAAPSRHRRTTARVGLAAATAVVALVGSVLAVDA